MSKYSDKFKDPRWQKKRLEKLEDSLFECENCGDGGKELHVHHRHYEKGKSPWDYDNDDLIVYCSDCHKEWHEMKEKLDIVIGNILSGEKLRRLLGYALNLRESDIFPDEIQHNTDIISGISDYYRTTKLIVYTLEIEAKKISCPLSFGKLYMQVVDFNE